MIADSSQVYELPREFTESVKTEDGKGPILLRCGEDTIKEVYVESEENCDEKLEKMESVSAHRCPNNNNIKNNNNSKNWLNFY